MGQRRWNKIRRQKADEVYQEGVAKMGEETKKFMAKLDKMSEEWKKASPAEREVIRRRILGDGDSI